MSAAQGASAESTLNPSDPLSVPVVAPTPEVADDVGSAHAAKPRNEGPHPAKPARPALVKAVASAQPAKSPLPATAATAPELAQPSSSDPLDRRK